MHEVQGDDDYYVRRKWGGGGGVERGKNLSPIEHAQLSPPHSSMVYGRLGPETTVAGIKYIKRFYF